MNVWPWKRKDGKVVYIAKVYRQDPETRWFHRTVLRRRFRVVLLHAGVCDGFSLEQNLNRITNATIVLRDPSEDIARAN